MKALTLTLVLASISPSSAQALVCEDDPNYTFGRYTFNNRGQTVEIQRNCAWLTNKSRHMQKRINEWCNPKKKWAKRMNVAEKCPQSCGKCNPTSCQDTPDWYDEGGPGFDCNFYALSNHCERWGHDFAGKSDKTANEACCVCGGGTIIDDKKKHTVTKKCRNIKGWYDQAGPLFGCEWYEEEEERCAYYGYRFKSKGMVANEACCACGGGNRG